MAVKATEILEVENRTIQRAAASLALISADLAKGNRVATDTLRNLSQFLDVFLEQCHQRKEEAFLFRILEQKGVPASGCPLAVLSNEHAKERVLVRQFADAVDIYVRSHGTVRASLQATLHALLGLLPGHIWKEDYLLLPLADKILSPEEQDSLRRQFDQLESEMGPEIRRAIERLPIESGSVPQRCP